MPLPIINPNTLEPTGEFLPLEDYFNPTKNLSYDTDLSASHRFLRGYMTVEDIKKVGQILSHPDAIEDLLPGILAQFTSNGTGIPYYLNLLRLVYDSLPEDNKWLIFFAGIRTGQATDNGHQFNVTFRVPATVSYSELVTSTFSVPLSTTTRDLVSYHPTEDQKAGFRTDLLGFLPNILSYWDRIPSTATLVTHDNSNSYIIRAVIQYISDKAIIHPEGNSDDCPIPFDYYSPSTLRDYANAGIRITFGYSRNFQKLSYRATYASNDRGRIARVLNYSTNVLTVLPYIIKGPKETSAPTYGVELESCSDYTPRQMVDAQKDLFFIMKQDGSISGSKPQKYEIVTVPASLKAHKRLWAELFEKIDYNNFDTTKDTGNGMHVHVGRKAFTGGHLNRFTWFITNPAHFEFMFAVSERPNKTDLNRWAPMPFYDGFRSKHKASQSAVSRAADLRGAVHFKGNTTVEVRMFKGIVSYATIIKNLEFVDSVFHFTQSNNLSRMTLKNYIVWLRSTEANRYQTLKTFLAEIPIDNLTAAAEVQDYIWREKADWVIAEKLNKAPFKVTNSHITTLNKSRRKRTFVLKNGQVICIANNGGLLAKLDKSLSKKQTRGAATFTMTEVAA